MKKTILLFSLFALIANCYGQNGKDEFNAYPLVSAEEIAEIAPIIKKWTDFYKIDFAKAKRVSVDSVCITCPSDTESIYYREFGENENTDKRIDVDYSPNKQRYVDLGMFYGYKKREDGKYDFWGWDDSQEIYLIDREQKIQNLVLWLGSSPIAEAVFWKSNDIFMIVGYNQLVRHFVYVYDMAKKTISYYEIISSKEKYQGYMNKVYWKEKGIIVVD
jgi:hypothetical protein